MNKCMNHGLLVGCWHEIVMFDKFVVGWRDMAMA